VKFALNTDSQSTFHLRHLRFGVAQAQRAWLTPDDVITAWPLAKVRAFIKAKSKKG
jgi:DNA polymerase (family 10)